MNTICTTEYGILVIVLYICSTHTNLPILRGINYYYFFYILGETTKKVFMAESPDGLRYFTYTTGESVILHIYLSLRHGKKKTKWPTTMPVGSPEW
jgi:hypothetical protein